MSNLMTYEVDTFSEVIKGVVDLESTGPFKGALRGSSLTSLGGSLTSRPCSPCNQNPLTIQPFDPTASPMTRIWQVSPSQLILRVPPNGQFLSVLYVTHLKDLNFSGVTVSHYDRTDAYQNLGSFV